MGYLFFLRGRVPLFYLVLSIGLFFGFLGSPQASTCGNGLCEIGEKSLMCPADCPKPEAEGGDEKKFRDQGISIRGVPYKGGALFGLIAAGRENFALQALKSGPDVGAPMSGVAIKSRARNSEESLENPSPFVLRDGSILMAFRHHVVDEKGHEFRLRVAKSTDGGKSWAMTGEGPEGFIDRSRQGLWEPFLYTDAKGVLRVVYAKERPRSDCPRMRGNAQDIVMRKSLDGGATWEDEVVVAREGISRDGVPSIARLRDGSYLMVFESWRNTQCGKHEPGLVIRSMQSMDGVNWVKRRSVYIPDWSSRKGSVDGQAPIATWPFVLSLADGRVALAYTTNENYPHIRREIDGEDPEKDKAYDIMVVLSAGGASFDSLEWDWSTLTKAYAFNELGLKNRFPALMQMEKNNLVVLSAMPPRLKVMRLGGSK